MNFGTPFTTACGCGWYGRAADLRIVESPGCGWGAYYGPEPDEYTAFCPECGGSNECPSDPFYHMGPRRKIHVHFKPTFSKENRA